MTTNTLTLERRPHVNQVNDDDVILDYTEWRQSHLPEYDNVEDLLRDAEEFSSKLERLGKDAVRRIALSGYKTFEEREAAVDAHLKANAAML